MVKVGEVMDVVARIAESKIKEAMVKGEFKDLPGKGQPMVIEDLSHIPEELRAGYKILKNSGMLPEELQLKKDIVTLEGLINCCYDEEELARLKVKLTENLLRYNILMEKKGRTATMGQYKNKILNKLGKLF